MPSIDLILNLVPEQAGGFCTVYSHWNDPRDFLRMPVTGRANFDLGRLSDEELSLKEYGRLLADGLFSDPSVLADFQRARKTAQDAEADLRLRIGVGGDAPGFHELRWEALCDPDFPHETLTAHEKVHFSRLLVGDREEWLEQPKPRQGLRVLAVVAAPAKLDRDRFAPIDVAEWVRLVKASLGDKIPIEWLGTPQAPATAEAIVGSLRQGRHDILILVAHGYVAGDEPWVWLEGTGVGPEREAERVSGTALVEQIGRLMPRPRLAVLCSCQSGGAGGARGAGDWKVLSALGPRLAKAGVPAVVAMQGLIPMSVARDFLGVFFEEIRRDGQVDRAMAVARSRIADRPQCFWMPTLFLRLISGNVRWYNRGFRAKDHTPAWTALIENIIYQRCTPILGPGFNECLSGSSRDLARRWSREPKFKFPLASLYGADLHHVAQYLAITESADLPYDRFRRDLCEDCLRRFEGKLPKPLTDRYKKHRPVDSDFLHELLVAAWSAWVETPDRDSYAILSRLPFPVYLTANPDNLMFEALRKARTLDGQPKDPHRVDFAWRNPEVQQAVLERLTPGGRIEKVKPDVRYEYKPSEERPLVGHLMGSFRSWESVPVTEDDYFEFLLLFKEKREKLHHEVQLALGRTSLLLLGFRVDDWSFRVLLHALGTIEASVPPDRRLSIAVQLNPDDERVCDAAGANVFFEKFLRQKKINVYWGSAEDFLNELWREWEETLVQAGEG